MKTSVLQLNEQSEYNEDNLLLTSQLIDLNPSFYSAWIIRRKILCDLSARSTNVFSREWLWISELTKSSPKNYQIWQHRKYTAIHVDINMEEESQHLNEALILEPKNAHVWSYRYAIIQCRIWFATHYKRYTAELVEAHAILDRDPLNNSAAHYVRILELIKLQLNSYLLIAQLESGRSIAKFLFTASKKMNPLEASKTIANSRLRDIPKLGSEAPQMARGLFGWYKRRFAGTITPVYHFIGFMIVLGYSQHHSHISTCFINIEHVREERERRIREGLPVPFL